MNKAEIRKKYKASRAKIAEEDIEEKSLAIANHLLNLPIWEGEYYHLFLSIQEKKEINTEYILHILQGRDKSVILPRADFSKNEMSNILLQENTSIAISTFGIPEPVSGVEIIPSLLDVVFVPLLAYDELGNRVGYGKGFYDRLLAKCKEETLFIGLSFFPPEQEIPVEVTDIPLHFCVTPENIFTFQ